MLHYKKEPPGSFFYFFYFLFYATLFFSPVESSNLAQIAFFLININLFRNYCFFNIFINIFNLRTGKSAKNNKP